MEASLEDLREIARLVVESDLQVLYVEIGDVRMGLSKSDAAAPLLFGQFGGVGPAADGTPAPARPAAEGPAAGGAGSSGAAAAPAAEAAKEPPAAQAAVAQGAAGAHPGPSTAAKEGLVDVKATSLGVIYRRPAPDQPAFVEVGSEVHAGDTVCLIEVMKTYNRVEAPCGGRVAEICAADGTMVAHGETLMRIEPAAEIGG